MGTEVEAKEYVRLPIFLEQGFLFLKRDVLEKRICCLCGTCAAFCDKIKISENELKPELVEEYDTICGMCYAFCPRTFLPLSEIEERIFGEEEARKKEEGDVLGVYRSCYAVRSKKGDIKGQDGGAVTSLLAYALEEGIIDSAVITTTREDGEWKPIPKVAKNYEELKEGAGTKYTIYPGVVGIKEAMEAGCENIGFVGLPCQIQGLRKVQTAEQPYEVGKERIKLLIGLFCMENFKEELLDFVKKKVSLDLERVRKFDIKGKEFLVYDEEGKVYAIALDEIKEYESEGCSVCMDYTAELADISVGSVGSEDGWSTVFARTEKGEEIVKGALEEGYVEVKEIEDKGLGLIRRLGERKRRRGEGLLKT